jgi:hypothetical protein
VWVCVRACVRWCVRARTNIHAHGKILFEFLLRPGEAMYDSGRQALHVFLLQMDRQYSPPLIERRPTPVEHLEEVVAIAYHDFGKPTEGRALVKEDGFVHLLGQLQLLHKPLLCTSCVV